VLETPKLSWWYKIGDVLRATWANNHGALLLTHPSMSEWYEWPFMLHRSVPFGDTNAGGRLKAFGNPGIYYPVAITIAVVTVVLLVAGLIWLSKFLISWRKQSGGDVYSLLWYVNALRARYNSDSMLYRACTTVNAIGGGGFVVPFLTLLLGYYLNLVPYQLIERCKFAYHYIPALIVGMMFVTFSADMALRLADLPLTGNPAALKYRKWAALAFVGLLYTCAWLGFYYWTLPYGYGVPLSWEEHRKRMWVRAWANNDHQILQGMSPHGANTESWVW
jgi:dolichyl-phosphate-mannose--protein O-mannosyl transferase